MAALMAGMLSENWIASRTPDRAALELVGLGRDEAATEVRGDVHEHGGGGQRLVIDADQVVDRLDGRSRLAPAVGQDVELGLELLVALGRVARRADIGEDLAGAVVHHRACGVVDVVAAQAEDPRASLGRDLAAGEDRRRVLRVGRSRCDVDPLLGGLLHVVVERGDDPVPAGVHLRAVGRVVRAEHLGQVAAHLPHELRCLPGRRDLADQLDGFLLGRFVFGDGVLVAGQRAARLHQVEDLVAALDDLRVLRDDELEVGALLAVRHVRVEAVLLGVAHQVVGGR